MSSEARKLYLIEAVLKTEDETVLREIETIFFKQKQPSVGSKKSFRDFAGIWTEEEAEKMKKDIEEACGQIHPDDWK